MAQSSNSLGMTPLHVAAFEGDRAAIKHLIEEGANVTVRDELQKMPLHEAATRNQAAVIDLLLSYGANPFAVDAHGWTSLHHAAAFEFGDPLDAVATIVNHLRCPCACHERC